MTLGLLDAFDGISWSETLLQRLHAASAELGRKQGLHAEKEWLTQAVDRLEAAREGVGDVLRRAMRLPELESLREDHARSLQQTAVDAVERLQAGITFHAGARAPILEALFGKLKYPVLRRADREDFERFCADFERRLASSYCKRMFADPQYEFAGPVLEEVRTAFGDWRQAFSAERLPAAQETALRDELEGHARRLELPMRQAKLLAEAALAPIRNAFEDSGLGQRPKRRNAKAVVTESEAGPGEFDSEAEVPDAVAPTDDERAELAQAESAAEREADEAQQVADVAVTTDEAPAVAVATKAPKKPRKSRANAAPEAGVVTHEP